MDKLVESLSLELDIAKEKIEQFITQHGERKVKEQLISISAANLNNKVGNPMEELAESLKKKGEQIKENEAFVDAINTNNNDKVLPQIKQETNSHAVPKNDLNIDSLHKDQINELSINKSDRKLLKKFIEQNSSTENSIYNLSQSIVKINENLTVFAESNELILKQTKTQEGKDHFTKFGFYCLLTILSMLFYIVGAFGYFVWNTGLFSRVNSYVLSISIPCIVFGIAVGIMYKPIWLRIIKRNKRHE